MQGKITKYIMNGPQAIEERLTELEGKLALSRKHLNKVVLLRIRYIANGTGGLLGRGTRLIAGILMKTIREINHERELLQNFLGTGLRVWETKKSDPAPL